MSLFRTVVLVAAAAGLVAGLALTAVQQFATVPLILHAETYEHAAPAPTAHAHPPGTAAHHHDAGWSPAPGVERFAYTALANVVGAIGFAVLLVVASEIAGGIANWRQGVFWGLGGFAAVTLAPSLGLPPELPGMPAADLLARQIWWIATAVLTAGGLALAVFRRSLPAAVAGLILILTPHLIGAPQPAQFDTTVPPALARNFVVAVVMSSLVFWVLLGGLAGYLRARLTPADS
jgi:cobalt transporter subunit CbtA